MARDLLVGMGIAACLCLGILCATSLALEAPPAPLPAQSSIRLIPSSALAIPSPPMPIVARMTTDAPAPNQDRPLPRTDIPTATPAVATVPFSNTYAGQGAWVTSTAPGDSTPRDEDLRDYFGKMAVLQHRRHVSSATSDPYQASLNPVVFPTGNTTP